MPSKLEHVHRSWYVFTWGGNTPNLLLSQNQPVICPLKAGLFHVKYKCNICHLFFSSDEHIVGDKCPKCNSKVIELCDVCGDHMCNCINSPIQGIAYCDKCGEMICPQCGGWNVTQVSRVTGYLSDVQGWGASKRRELIDRTRVTL